MLYRVLDPLNRKQGLMIPMGTLSILPDFSEKTKKILVEAGKIAPVYGPPLAELPGWEARARRVKRLAGIEGSNAFVEAALEGLALQLGRSVEEVRTWQDEVLSFLKGV